MERLLTMGVSQTDFLKLGDGLARAEKLVFRQWPDLEIVMSWKGRHGKEEKQCICIPANEDLDDLSEESQELIIETLCPYMSEKAVNVRALDICWCRPRMTRSFLKCFREHKLHTFFLDECDDILEESDVQQVKGTFKHLENFEMHGGHLDLEAQTGLVEALAETKSLLTFKFWGVSLNQTCFRGLLERLTQNQRLEYLELHSGSLKDQTPQNLRQLGRMVARHPCLEYVNIDGNSLGDRKCSAFLVELAERTGPPISLDMDRNDMGIEGYRELGRILSTRDAILKLGLYPPSDEAAVIFFDSLCHNTSLKKFNNRYDFSPTIGSSGAAAMRNMLERNETISGIDVNTGTLSDEGLEVILSGLERNRGATDFSLTSESPGLLAYEHLSQVVSHNSVLRDLSVQQKNTLTTAMARVVSGALPHNTTLESFSIYLSTGIEEGATNILVNGLTKNNSIMSWPLGLFSYEEIFTARQREILEHHCRFNRFGRKYLVDPNLIPLELYPWILAKAAKDIKKGNKSPKWGLDVLHDVVRNRPEVYDVNPRRSHVGQKRKSRDAQVSNEQKATALA